MVSVNENVVIIKHKQIFLHTSKAEVRSRKVLAYFV